MWYTAKISLQKNVAIWWLHHCCCLTHSNPWRNLFLFLRNIFWLRCLNLLKIFSVKNEHSRSNADRHSRKFSFCLWLNVSCHSLTFILFRWFIISASAADGNFWIFMRQKSPTQIEIHWNSRTIWTFLYPFSQFYFHFYYNFRHLKNFSNHKYSAELYVPEKCDKNKFSWELHEIPMAKVCR